MKPRIIVSWLSILFLIAGVFGWAGAASRWMLIRRAQCQQDECAAHLQLIHRALQQYQADHGGRFPQQSLRELVPRYLPQGDVLICPTVRSRPDLAQQFLRADGQNCTFLALYLDRNFRVAAKEKGGEVALVACTFHSWEAAGHLHFLILRANGRVDVVIPGRGTGPCLSYY